MQVTRDAVNDNPTSARRVANPRFVPWLLGITAGLFLLAIGWYYAAFIYARPITRYGELQSHVGKRVAFLGVFNGDDKAHDLIILDGHRIRLYHTLGAIEWSPDTGEECRVTGVIKYDEHNMFGIPYALTEAEYFPVEAAAVTTRN